jgi:3-deoxy-7-phosphoheptulonate synthase
VEVNSDSDVSLPRESGDQFLLSVGPMTTLEPWTPDSWQGRAATQQPDYPDQALVRSVVDELSRLPPLVTSWEIEALRQQLAEAARGERFILHGGDCAESFQECAPERIAANLKVLLQMSLVLMHGTHKPVILVGRLAGQYAKPRSEDVEVRNGTALPSYRGDLVNGVGFSPEERAPDPQRMLRGYQHAAMTLNFVRALADGGFTDLRHPEYWDLPFVRHSARGSEYRRVVEAIRDAIAFMEAAGEAKFARLRRMNVFTSHEGLLLYYEQAQTRRVPHRGGWYDLSTHFPWIGMRTAKPEGAHVGFFRGVRNPVAVKLGPDTQPDQLQALLRVLHPDDEPGRLTLIHRLGARHTADRLPAIIEAVRESGRTVVWCCDPMHGNTETTSDGVKTRRFESILSELRQSFEIHDAMGSILAGVHFEMTGEDVTECLGGAQGLTEHDLGRAYRSRVDPRLNYEQALEMAMLIGQHVRRRPQPV